MQMCNVFVQIRMNNCLIWLPYCFCEMTSGPTPWLECVYVSVHDFLCPSDSQYHLKPPCIVTWKHGCPCVALWLCLNHPTSFHTPWLEYVYASVHVYMSTSPPCLLYCICIVTHKHGWHFVPSTHF